jgi:hypothetical protein
VKHAPVLLAISGQLLPYRARRYYKDPTRGLRSIAEVEFEIMNEHIAGELERFRLGIYSFEPAKISYDHVPDGAA